MTILSPETAGPLRPRADVASRRRGRRRGTQPSGLPWILPAFLFVVGILYYCIVETGYLSTLDWDGVSPTPVSVGAQNFIDIFHDPVFWKAIRNTLEFFVLTFVVQTAAMGQIDPEILEAARMDGAGNIRTLASIIWPSVSGTTIALGMLSVIGALKTFDVPYLVTIGGPN